MRYNVPSRGSNMRGASLNESLLVPADIRSPSQVSFANRRATAGGTQKVLPN